MKNDGGPAFPAKLPVLGTGGYHGEVVYENLPGMSLRDWFAGMAMQGQLAALANQHVVSPVTPDELPDQANFSYQVADAMLAERDKKD